MALPFDKYDLYLKSVQAPDVDAEFLRDTYKEINKVLPQTLREDFCGTFALCCEWVKLNKKFIAYGVDLDLEPIHYGETEYLPKLKPEQQIRIHLQNKNVMDHDLPKVDIIAAQNFSYFCFKNRAILKEYFENCYRTLKTNGLLVTDCFGGSGSMEPNEEETRFKKHSYFWDQDNFNPITHEAKFHIHFKLKGQKKIKNVFSYDWRLWTIPELRDIMTDAGFSRTVVYWEMPSKKGQGNGDYSAAERGVPDTSWIAYVVGVK